jgi:hypothetical protein
MADVRELRGRFDAYMGALAALTGADAEAAMKAALEAVDQLDNALSLDRVRLWVLLQGVQGGGRVLQGRYLSARCCMPHPTPTCHCLLCCRMLMRS